MTKEQEAMTIVWLILFGASKIQPDDFEYWWRANGDKGWKTIVGALTVDLNR